MKPLYLLALVFSLVALLAIALLTIQSEPGRVAVVSIEQEPVHHEPAAMASEDSYLDKQWAIPKIMAPQAWQVTSGDASVVIAVPLFFRICSFHTELKRSTVKLHSSRIDLLSCWNEATSYHSRYGW